MSFGDDDVSSLSWAPQAQGRNSFCGVPCQDEPRMRLQLPLYQGGQEQELHEPKGRRTAAWSNVCLNKRNLSKLQRKIE